MITQAMTGGWVWVSHWERGEDDVAARIRLAPRGDGRFEAVELHLEGPRGLLTGNAYRSVPVKAIEAWANSRGYDELVASIKESGAKVDAATDRWLKTVGGGDREPPVRVAPRRRDAKLQLQIPQSRRKPDAFYRRVGQVYMRAVENGSHRPARLIAQANGVPIETVHRWIREARARGVMAPAERQGRAG